MTMLRLSDGKRKQNGQVKKGGKMGKSAQRKGAVGEQELAAVLQEYRYNIEREASLSLGLPVMTVTEN